MRKWTADKNANPPIYHTLKDGNKTIATVRRINGKQTKSGRWVYRYQLIKRFIAIAGDAIGPTFNTLAAAKRAAAKRAADQ